MNEALNGRSRHNSKVCTITHFQCLLDLVAQALNLLHVFEYQPDLEFVVSFNAYNSTR